MFLFDVSVLFDKFLDSQCLKSPELIKLGPDFHHFVKNHPRKRLVVENLCNQIVGFERNIVAQKQTVDRRNGLILSVAKMFIQAAKIAHEQSLMTEAEKIRLAHRNQPMEDVKDLLKEVPDGQTDKKDIII